MSQPQIAALVYCPFPDREAAKQAAEILLGESLIGCANVIGPLESVFRWKEQTQTSEEVGVLFKTNSTLLDTLIDRVGELHPFDTPAILGMKCDGAHSATLSWLAELSPEDM